MAASLPKQLDLRAEYIAFGYLRKQSKILFESNDETLFQNIPDAICSLCALYYGSRDYFEIVPNTVLLSDDALSITKLTPYKVDQGYTSFGSMLIPSTSKCTCKWDVHIDHLHGTILVGISSKPFDPNIFCHNQTRAEVNDTKDHYAYVYGSSGQNKTFENNWNQIGIGSHFASHDIVSLYLDLQQNRLTFYINNTDSTIAFKVKTGKILNTD